MPNPKTLIAAIAFLGVLVVVSGCGEVDGPSNCFAFSNADAQLANFEFVHERPHTCPIIFAPGELGSNGKVVYFQAYMKVPTAQLPELQSQRVGYVVFYDRHDIYTGDSFGYDWNESLEDGYMDCLPAGNYHAGRGVLNSLACQNPIVPR